MTRYSFLLAALLPAPILLVGGGIASSPPGRGRREQRRGRPEGPPATAGTRRTGSATPSTSATGSASSPSRPRPNVWRSPTSATHSN
ncbi:hypothetical protein NKG94_35415 [Micromonospora sp. M12]